jgi:predicted amidohydrolase
LLLGSLAIKAGPGKVTNRSYLVDAAGEIAARYDKLHLFDVDLADGERYRESAAVAPGSNAVVAPTPWATLGLSICYDLRFPYLYRALAQAGAQILTVPAAFARTTGQAHWHVLLRARAIETGCYVLAPCQCGTHGGGRPTYGHSLIVDPWGRILADGGDEPGIVTATLDLAEVAKARAMIPALQHDRAIAGPSVSAS